MKSNHLKSIIEAIHRDSEALVEFAEGTPSGVQSVSVQYDGNEFEAFAVIGGDRYTYSFDEAIDCITVNSIYITGVY